MLDAVHPEQFRRPNYDANLFYSLLNEALASVFRDVVKVVTVAALAEGAIETKTFVYHGTDSVAAVRLMDENGHYEQWLDALGESFEHGPIQFSFHSSGRRSGPAKDLDRLTTDPASWIKNQAPSSWVSRSQAPTKASILKEAQKVARPAAVTDPELIGSLWNELVQLAGITTNLGATVADFDAFGKTCGFDIPEGLACLLSLSNGASDAFGFRSLMSVAEITKQWVEWKTIFDALTLDDLQDSYRSDQERTLAMYTTPHWVSFAEEGSGNYAAVDLLPGPAGRQGQIIYFGADETRIRWLASDIADFLRQEISQVRNGDRGTSWF